MVAFAGSQRGLSARQSYIGISNYLRGLYVAPRLRLQCQFCVRRQSHSAKRLGAEDISSYPFLENYKKINFMTLVSFPTAISDFSTLLEAQESGKHVTLYGYLGKRTDIGKKMSFVRLADPRLSQTVQAISFSKTDAFDKLKSIEPHSPVVLRGILQTKVTSAKESKQAPAVDKEGNINSLEIALEDIQLLNDFPNDIIMKPETVFPAGKRFLQIRNDREIRHALAFRARAGKVLREALEQCEPPFMEVETPLLFKSTPEGAREFLVPTRRPGFAYALPQSPQQYKQILMSGGIPRYYQFAHCFRDEDLRADRQPEFTQLDLEMSFASGEDVMNVIERIVRQLWSALMPEPLNDAPFPRMTYYEAMSKYGSDKPDPRIGMEIYRVDYMIPVDLVRRITNLSDPIVEVIKLKGNGDPAKTKAFTSSILDAFVPSELINNPEGRPETFVIDSAQPLFGLQDFGFEAVDRLESELGLDNGDLLVVQARRKAPLSGGSTPLGDLRRVLHKAATETGFKRAPTGFNFLWVTHFPLFSPSSDTEPGQGGTAGIASTHHPFTAPLGPEDVDLLLTDPTKVVADHYDLVVNGVELGGGSRRIHSAEVQKFILRDILKVPENRLGDFSHLLEALRAGCPPHAGIALGFDRLIAIMLGKESVRDVIAFPKSGKGEDVMVKTPSKMTEKALETYHLQLRQED
ncbi:hypothetical protein UREG_02730 [Uncinocarpus reesii 1704]|uniref:Aminoacyl-transfer RNA synthetases class-II family profile domain-containing protein n=1 Tax=Uncinocarpus reesii (strain UAMH 1704) TaxID=336963 RepID=C4JHP4_UNCRE|nr:uncharacterized protein UREG_02730 [Uncinocarpus reesii 1704]EEP77881.1 hypothetical protein UREG_02730 [Uncinocarpus reesii 1704]